MPEHRERRSTASDPATLARVVAAVAETSQRLVTSFLARQTADGAFDRTVFGTAGKAFLELTQRMLANPSKLMDAWLALWQQHADLWHTSALAAWHQQGKPNVAPTLADKRFRHPDWQERFVFDFIKQSYLLTARWLQATVSEVEGLDERSRKKIEFFTQQFTDALSPTNFLLTNPEVLRATIESGGENLLRGLRNLLEDLEEGKGKLDVRLTDAAAFRIGENLAVTPGTVVYQNELMQLLQYQPSTEHVCKRPLLVIPPWINKYYILDLQEKNSLIKWWVDHGLTVFVISWVNPDAKLAQKDFEDYMLAGPLAALDAIERATGEPELNAIGYCIGGTLLAPTLAYTAAKGDHRIKSATFFTALLDFTEPGDLEVFTDEEHISALEQSMERHGFLDGSYTARTFTLLRANDLLWSSVINRYLLGKEPLPFDILYWNSDSTRMPARMHSYYLRNMYLNNLLKEPHALTLAGQSIDLGTVATPAYFLSTVEDHIAPWQSVYAGTRLLAGRNRFVLSAAGHVAGVVNPPAARKYCYWTNSRRAPTAADWLQNATQHKGSWWPDWLRWVRRYAGPQVPARSPGARLPVIEDAPGRYVKVQ